jgi:hypothetical protein
MTSAHKTTPLPPAGKAREIPCGDGFGPLESRSTLHAREAARFPCIAFRWFSPRSRATLPQPQPCFSRPALRAANR